MNLTKLSKQRLTLTANRWTVCKEYFDPLFNYLVYGFRPGSFWEAVLANDFMAAVSCSHPANDIPHLKNAVGWIQDSFPAESWGSVRDINNWIRLTSSQRRMILEQEGLIYTEQEEIMLALKGVQAKPEPIMW